METSQIMIHVRFAPDGTVTEIGERPRGLSAQAWFNHLSRGTRDSYEILCGGRGIFRLSCEQLENLKQPFQVQEAES